MPIYQYYCGRCEKEFELKRLMAEIYKPALCPKCKKEGTRLVTAFSSMVGLHLKTPSESIFRQPPVTKKATSQKIVHVKKRSKK